MWRLARGLPARAITLRDRAAGTELTASLLVGQLHLTLMAELYLEMELLCQEVLHSVQIIYQPGVGYYLL